MALPTPRKVRPQVLDYDLSYNCHRLSQLIRDEIQSQLRALDPHLTPEQWHLLMCLAVVPEGMTPTELAVSALRDKTTVSRMLDVMARHGLIERIADKDDGRSYRVRLGIKSRQLIERARVGGISPGADRLFAALSGAEREFLLALVHKCRRSVGDL
jgi:DNA-binding MarR family transcriptional regulator